MAGAPVPSSNLQHRVAQLERELRRERQRLDRLFEIRGAATIAPQQIRSVRTWLNPEVTYPSAPANTFDIRFTDLSMSAWTIGEHTVTYSPRSDTGQTTAATFDGRWILPGKDCIAAMLNGKWWIIDGPGLHYVCRLNGSLTKGSSVGADIIDHNGTKEIDSGYDLTVRDWYHNTGGTLPTNTKVDVFMLFPGKYYVLGAGCAADSNSDSVYNP